MRLSRCPSVGFVAVALGLALPARAGPALLEAARAAYGGLDYERCIREAAGALEEPAARKDRIDAHRLLGLCHAALGDTEEARESFIRMLAIDPEARLPEGLSPRFTSSYLEARGHFVGQRPLSLSVEKDRIEGHRRIVLVEVSDPLGQVDKVSVRAIGGELSPGLKAAPRMELELPADSAVELVALDAHGGEVALLWLEGPTPKGSSGSPVVAAAAPEPGDASSREVEDVWLWATAGVGTAVLVAGVAAVGLGFALSPPPRVRLRSDVVFGDE